MNTEAYILDAIQEIINIGVGNSAAMLAGLTHSPIRLHVPTVSLLTLSDLDKEPDSETRVPMATVFLKFSGAFSGRTALMIPPESAASLVNLILQDVYAPEELDAVMVDTLKGVANIIVNGVMGSMSRVLKENLTYSIPSYHQCTLMTLIRQSGWDDTRKIILATITFQIRETIIVGKIIMVLDIRALEILIDRIQAGTTQNA